MLLISYQIVLFMILSLKSCMCDALIVHIPLVWVTLVVGMVILVVAIFHTMLFGEPLPVHWGLLLVCQSLLQWLLEIHLSLWYFMMLVGWDICFLYLVCTVFLVLDCNGSWSHPTSHNCWEYLRIKCTFFLLFFYFQAALSLRSCPALGLAHEEIVL